jgi:hypothetical protein
MQISAVPSSLRRDLIDAAERRGAYDYANHFEVGYSRACIVMTPAYAKALMTLLDDAIARFEDEHGLVVAAGGEVAEDRGHGG